MSVSNNAPGANQKTLEPQRHGDTSVKVNVRLIFLRIGEIDTLNEKYQAQASIKACWPVDFNELSSCLSHDDQKRLIDGKSVSLPNYAQSNWHPQLFIENVMGELKEQIRYSAKKSKQDNQIYVFENRDIKGSFWEKLELNHFPSDVQDLSISVGSMLFSDKVLLAPDSKHLSGVNREAFVDQQEWSLYEHVDTQQRFVTEFLFGDDDDEDDDDNAEEEDDGNIHTSVEHHVDNQLKNTDDTDDRKRSILTVTCHAARRSHYFYWNGYCLILLITMVSFCIFSIPPHFTGNRIQIVCTLLLTSITFRWTVNRSLPTISYLTSMDKYAIVCIFNLVAHAVWHAVIGFLIFINTTSPTIVSTSWFAKLDQAAFCIAIGVFFILHFIFIIWLFLVPLKHRKHMADKDVQYSLDKKNRRKCKSDKTQKKTSSGYTAVPVVNIEPI
ncbi:unnamed protein product [Rotaria socialis]|uniref:Neurotransmitter-gated ion-channel ligand-binding domain-containing protein n=1 Tax=Rotaria socialis TaxID=392032 RepID=A0A818GIT5_9BILA|nr:unnamed protein product [Rotaria socialis]